MQATAKSLDFNHNWLPVSSGNLLKNLSPGFFVFQANIAPDSTSGSLQLQRIKAFAHWINKKFGEYNKKLVDSRKSGSGPEAVHLEKILENLSRIMSQVFQEYMPLDVNLQRNEVEDDIERELFELLQNFGETERLKTPEGASAGESLDIEFEEVQNWLDELEEKLYIQVTEEQTSDQNENENTSILARDETTGDSMTTNDPEKSQNDSTTTEVPEESHGDSKTTAVLEESQGDIKTVDVEEEPQNDSTTTKVPEETTGDSKTTDVPEESKGDSKTTDVLDESQSDSMETGIPEELQGGSMTTDVSHESQGDSNTTDVPEESQGDPKTTDLLEESQGDSMVTDALDESQGDSKTIDVSEVLKDNSWSADVPEESESDSDIEVLEVHIKNPKTSLISPNAAVPDLSTDDSDSKDEPEVMEIPVDTNTTTSAKRSLSSSSDDDVTEAYSGPSTRENVIGKIQEPRKKVRIEVVDISSSDEEVDVESVTPAKNTKSEKRRSPRFQNLPPQPPTKPENTKAKAGKKSGRKPTRQSPRFISHGLI